MRTPDYNAAPRSLAEITARLRNEQLDPHAVPFPGGSGRVDYRATLLRLHAAFELLKASPGVWKDPVDAFVTWPNPYATTPDELREACVFFTGSVPEVTFLKGAARARAVALIGHDSGRVARVTAAGYYATIGA